MRTFVCQLFLARGKCPTALSHRSIELTSNQAVRPIFIRRFIHQTVTQATNQTKQSNDICLRRFVIHWLPATFPTPETPLKRQRGCWWNMGSPQNGTSPWPPTTLLCVLEMPKRYDVRCYKRHWSHIMSCCRSLVEQYHFMLCISTAVDKYPFKKM